MNSTVEEKNNSKKTLHIIRHVTWVGFWVNAFLMALKLVVGYTGHSDALVADGYHSLSDFATDFVVLIFVGIAYKQADDSHPYGHGKFETFASLLIAVALIFVAVFIGWEGVETLRLSLSGHMLVRPDILTLVVAFISILAKEGLFHYTYRAGKKINSSSLVANAWHHRSDAISSVATMIGIGLAYFLGEAWRIADPIASIMVSVLILVSAVKVASPAIAELLDAGLPEQDRVRISQAISKVNGVMGYHHLRTHRNGNTLVVECHIKVQPDITVIAGHEIATSVEEAIESLYHGKVISTVHIEPYTPGHEGCVAISSAHADREQGNC